MITPTDPADPGTWEPLVRAVNDVGQGQTVGFDQGFAACLAALGWPADRIAALFALALAREEAMWTGL